MSAPDGEGAASDPLGLVHAPSDSWVLVAVYMAGERGGDVRSLVATADYVNHAIPTFEELAEGLLRLERAGLVARHEGRFAASPSVRALAEGQGRSMAKRWRAVSALLDRAPNAQGAPPAPSPAGAPLPISREAYDAALDDYLRR